MHLQDKSFKNTKSPSFNLIDDSNVSSVHYSKENCLSLSNQSESLLISSLRVSSSHQQETATNKKQKKLNSDFLNHERTKTFHSLHKNNSFGQSHNHNMTINQCLPKQSTYNSIKKSSNSIEYNCIGCQKQLPLFKQKLQATTHRLEQLQALVKICFMKTLTVEKSLSQKNQQLLEIKIRQDDLQRNNKKTQQVLVKQSVSKGMQSQELKCSLSKLTDKISEKSKELSEIIELQKVMLQQKICKISTFYDQKFDSLISMVQQLAKSQQKMVNSQRESTLSKIDFENSQQIQSLNKRMLLPTQNKQNRFKVPSSEKGRCNQSKSKISYYLSKSNLNDTTTLGDMSINHLSAIGVGNNY